MTRARELMSRGRRAAWSMLSARAEARKRRKRRRLTGEPAEIGGRRAAEPPPVHRPGRG